VVLHSWGDYKVEFAGIHPKFQNYLGGQELASVERAFYERFRPDWIHHGSVWSRGFWERPRRVDGDRAFLRSADDQRWLEILDNYVLSVSDHSDGPSAQRPAPPFRLESKAAIDEYYAATRQTVEDVLESGRFAHMQQVAAEYGDRVLIAVNDGTPGWLPGHSFEDLVIACMDQPELVAHNIFRACEGFLTVVRAAKACGAHAYIFSEGFPLSLDVLSPAMHERIEGEARRWFYAEVLKLGILPIGYWLGDVRPNMPMINRLNMAGMMIEEDKNGFVLDPVEIRRLLRPETCLFGNLDSALLRNGTPEAIRSEVRRQRKAAAEGPFVLANGSPIIIGTPVANLDAYMQEARHP
jgi:hypothetical protein